MRAARYRIALLSLFAAVAPCSCRTFTEPFLDLGQVDHVDVFGGLVEVGDTITASAGAFRANGSMTAMTAPRVWTIADPSVAEVRGERPFGGALIGGLRPGTTRISARVGDVEGSATLRVIPRLAPITFVPAAVSMRLGDSVQVTAVIRTTAGEMVTDVDVFWLVTDIGVVGAGCCTPNVWLRSSKVYGRAGTTTVTASVAHATGVVQVTVSP